MLSCGKVWKSIYPLCLLTPLGGPACEGRRLLFVQCVTWVRAGHVYDANNPGSYDPSKSDVQRTDMQHGGPTVRKQRRLAKHPSSTLLARACLVRGSDHSPRFDDTEVVSQGTTYPSNGLSGLAAMKPRNRKLSAHPWWSTKIIMSTISMIYTFSAFLHPLRTMRPSFAREVKYKVE